MHFVLLLSVLCCGLANARSIKSELKISQTERTLVSSTEMEDVPESNQQPDDEPFNIARFFATQRLLHRMIKAVGVDVVKSNFKLPENMSITIDSSIFEEDQDSNCPNSLYLKCNRDMYPSSCHPPVSADPSLWDDRMNLHFELTPNFLAKDKLMNALLRIYKNGSLPLAGDTRLSLELFVYTRGLTKQYDINFLYDSKVISNNYIGWITFNVTDLIRKMRFSSHHGFLVKVKEYIGVYWNAPDLIVSRNCSDMTPPVIPIPFGVTTDAMNQKFPSLTIETGTPHEYNWDTSLNLDDDYNSYDHIITGSPIASEVNYVKNSVRDNKDLNKISKMNEEELEIVRYILEKTNKERQIDIDIEEDEIVPSDKEETNSKNIKHHFHIKTSVQNQEAESNLPERTSQTSTSSPIKSTEKRFPSPNELINDSIWSYPYSKDELGMKELIHSRKRHRKHQKHHKNYPEHKEQSQHLKKSTQIYPSYIEDREISQS